MGINEKRSYWVYKLTSPSGKVYIGISSNIIKRFTNYSNISYTGTSLLRSSLIKYGFSNFKKEILHTHLTKTEACEIEISMIESFKKLGNTLNISAGGETGSGLKGSTHPRSKPLFQLNLQGGIIKEWDNASDASKELNLNQTVIASALRNNNYAYKFLWMYKDEYNPASPPTYKSTQGKTLRVPISQLTKEGKLVKHWDSASEAGRELKILHGNIASCVLRNKKSYKGFLWCYKSDYLEGNIPIYTGNKNSKAVERYDLEGNLLDSFNSVIEASKKTGLDRSTIIRILKKKVKPRKFDWRYSEE